MKKNNIFLLTILASFIFICGCTGKVEEESPESPADVQVTIEDSFEDELFRKYISENIDIDKDGCLSEEEIVKVETININGNTEPEYSGLQSLDGIELFTELRDLTCYNCNLSEIDVRNNIALERLVVGYTQIDKIDVSKNKSLIEIDCSATEVSELDISSNKFLKELYISDSKIKDIDLSDAPYLESFFCANTEISSIDVTGNPMLTDLAIDYTDISAIDLSLNSKLLSLTCIETSKLTELDLSKNTNLESIYCQRSGLSKLDISNCPNMYELECSDNLEVIGGEDLTFYQRFPNGE